MAAGAGTADETRARFREYRRTGDRRLRDELINENIGLARSVARRYSGRGESLEDLNQVAMLGLLKAVERFEPERGLAFSTFAVPTISGEIKRHFRDYTWAVRVPRSIQDLALRVNSTIAELSTELGMAPSVDDIAHALEVSVEDVLEAMEANRSYSTDSLDAPRDETSAAVHPALGTEDGGYEAIDRRELVDWLLDTLPERERAIVSMRFQDGLTQSQIAERIGISQMHVSRLLTATIALLAERLDQA